MEDQAAVSRISGFAADAWIRHREALARVAFATLYAAGLQADVEDVVSEVAVQLLEHPPAGVLDWEAYLVTMTQRRAIDHIRSAYVRRRDGSDFDLDSARADDYQIEDLLEGLDVVTDLKAAVDVLASLPGQEQFVARECLWKQRPQREVADELGITQARVSQILKSARAKLKEAVEQKGVNIG
jgi:RNA polymerase sigma factor (sigma-70 family)